MTGIWVVAYRLRIRLRRVIGAITCLLLGHRRKFGAVPSMSCIRCGNEWRQ